MFHFAAHANSRSGNRMASLVDPLSRRRHRFPLTQSGNTRLRFCSLVLLVVMNNTRAFGAYVIRFECHFLCWLIESRREGEYEVLQRFYYLAALLCNRLSTAVAWPLCDRRFVHPLITTISFCFFFLSLWFGCSRKGVRVFNRCGLDNMTSWHRTDWGPFSVLVLLQSSRLHLFFGSR